MLFASLVRGVLKKEYLYAFLMVLIAIYGVSETVIFRAVMMPLFAYTFFSTVKEEAKSSDNEL